MGFAVVIEEGLFETSEAGLLVTDHRGPRDALASLRKLVGSRVRVAVHLVPTMPLDPSARGAGSCRWREPGCPAGHDEDPTALHAVSAEGFLRAEGNRWWVESFDGASTELGLERLPGHDARIVAATVADVSAMRDAVSSSTAADLVERVVDLEAAIAKLRPVRS